MKFFKKDIKKIMTQLQSGEIDLEDAVRKACVAFDKEVSAPEDDIAQRRADFKKRMEPYIDEYPSELLESFYNYWTAFQTPKAKLMWFEKQKSFNMGMRLATWYKNSKNFGMRLSAQKVVRRGGLNGK